MKKKILLIISAMALLGIGIAVYAVNSNLNTTNATTMSCCCCSGDSCPMKSKDAKAGAAADAGHSCDCACCKDGSCPMMKEGKMKMSADGTHSCPMMKDGAHKMDASMDHDMKNPDGTMKMADGKSCPMMKEGMKGHDMHDATMPAKDGKAGCSCACCNPAKEKKDAPAV